MKFLFFHLENGIFIISFAARTAPRSRRKTLQFKQDLCRLSSPTHKDEHLKCERSVESSLGRELLKAHASGEAFPNAESLSTRVLRLLFR